MHLLESGKEHWETMADIAGLADALHSEEVARAKALRPEDGLLEGPRLFERA